jgi:hypothetical protein
MRYATSAVIVKVAGKKVASGSVCEMFEAFAA